MTLINHTAQYHTIIDTHRDDDQSRQLVPQNALATVIFTLVRHPRYPMSSHNPLNWNLTHPSTCNQHSSPIRSLFTLIGKSHKSVTTQVQCRGSNERQQKIKTNYRRRRESNRRRRQQQHAHSGYDTNRRKVQTRLTNLVQKGKHSESQQQQPVQCGVVDRREQRTHELCCCWSVGNSRGGWGMEKIKQLERTAKEYRSRMGALTFKVSWWSEVEIETSKLNSITKTRTEQSFFWKAWQMSIFLNIKKERNFLYTKNHFCSSVVKLLRERSFIT